MKLYLPVVFLLLSGCFWNNNPTSGDKTSMLQATADFNFSNAGNIGTYNSGSYQAGSVFLWNSNPEVNSMTFIETLPLQKFGAPNFQGSRNATNASGFGLTIQPETFGELLPQISAGISSQTSFTAVGIYRQDYNKVKTALRDYVRQAVDERLDVDGELKPRVPGMRLVVIRSTLSAANAELRIGGKTEDDIAAPRLTFSLGDPENPDVQVDLSSSSEVKCTDGTVQTDNKPQVTERTPEQIVASSPICFFNVVVYDPYYPEDGGPMQFAIDENAPLAQLPAAFRSIR